MRTPRILATGQDPGGAEALAPVLSRLTGRYDLRIVAGGQAGRVFTGEGLSWAGWDGLETGPSATAVRSLLEGAPDLVVTATSFGPGPERAFIRAARCLGIPCLTVLDSWTNYRRRFLDEGETELSAACLPDVIAVMDDFAAAEMEQAGFPRQILRVVGQPAFDRFAIAARAFGAGARAAFRADLAIPESERIIVYFSQPISALYGRGGSLEFREYTEFDVLRALVEAMVLIDVPVVLIVKTHPKEPPGKYRNLPGGLGVPHLLLHEFNADRLVLGADVIVGVNSVVLMKAFLARRHVISLQPTATGEDVCVLGRAGYVAPVREGRVLVPVLRAAVDGAGGRRGADFLPGVLTDGLATERIVGIIDQMALRGCWWPS